MTKQDVVQFINGCYEKNLTQPKIAEELNALSIQCPFGQKWTGNYASAFALQHGLRKKFKRNMPVVRAESTISFKTIGKILTSGDLTDTEKRNLLHTLTK